MEPINTINEIDIRTIDPEAGPGQLPRTVEEAMQKQIEESESTDKEDANNG